MKNLDNKSNIEAITESNYKFGFVTDLDSEKPPKGLSESTIKYISKKKNEPEWMLDWRLQAYDIWLKMKEPEWSELEFNKFASKIFDQVEPPSKVLYNIPF